MKNLHCNEFLEEINQIVEMTKKLDKLKRTSTNAFEHNDFTILHNKFNELIKLGQSIGLLAPDIKTYWEPQE